MVHVLLHTGKTLLRNKIDLKFTVCSDIYEDRKVKQSELALDFMVDCIVNRTYQTMPSALVVIDCRDFWESRHSLVNSMSGA